MGGSGSLMYQNATLFFQPRNKRPDLFRISHPLVASESHKTRCLGTPRLVIVVCLLACVAVGAGAGFVFPKDPTGGYGTVAAAGGLIAALVLIALGRREQPQPIPASAAEPQPERELEPDSWQQQLLSLAVDLKGSGSREA